MTVEVLSFSEVIEDLTRFATKIPKSAYASYGKYPIIDQSQNSIAGYTDDENFLYRKKVPVIVFGDHTKIFKYIDSRFTIGADGTKILGVKGNNETRFIYHYLKNQCLPDAGYSRHYKYLKETSFILPPLKEQERIVEIFDRAENIIRLRQLAIETTQRIASALFYKMFGNPIRNEKGWETKEIGETCEQNRITYNNERDGQLTYLGLEHITNNTGDIVELSEEGVRGKATTFVFDDTHVLYGKLRPYLNKVVMPTFRGRCTTELIPYLPKPNIGRCYLTYLLRSETIVNTVVSNSTGTRMPRANLNYLESIKVGVPPYEIHKIFEDKVASMNEFLKRQRTSQETSHELYLSLRAQLLAA